MAGSLLPQPKQLFQDANWNPLIGGQIFTYAAGTLTPKTTYQDAALTIANTNPTLANARGEVLMYGDSAYRMILKDASDNTIYDVDNVETVSSQIANAFSTLAASGGSALISFMQSGEGAVRRSVQSKLRDFVTPEDFGALGGGLDDTAALKRAIATGRHVYIATEYTYQDATLDLRVTGQQIFGPGSLIQKSVAVTNVPANTAISYPASEYPAIKLSATGTRVQVSSVLAAWEGVQVSAANCFVLWTKFKAQGVSWYDGIVPFSNNPTIIGNFVEGFGAWPVGISAHRPRGDGIFLSAGDTGPNTGGVVALNTIRSCAKNGLFVIGQRGWIAHGNVIEGCAMSAIQIAFLNGLPGGNAANFSLTGNTGRYCGADSIDINNSSGTANEALHGSSTGNTFHENGFLYPTAAAQLSRTGVGLSNQDGAGYTLIAVSDFRSSGNYFNNCGRAILFAVNCENLDMNDSGVKTFSNPLDDTDGIRLSQVVNSIIRTDVKVPGNIYRAEGDCSGTVVSNSRWQNTVAGKMAITTPTGAVAPEFKGIRVAIESGGFIANCRNPIVDCSFSSTGAGTAEFFGRVNLKDVNFIGKQLNVSIIDPAELTLRGVTVAGNNNTSPLLQIRNSLAGHIHDVIVENAGTSAAAIFYGSSPAGSNWLRNTTFKNFAGGNSLRIEAEVPVSVTFFMDEIVSSPGFPDLTGGTKKTLTWV